MDSINFQVVIERIQEFGSRFAFHPDALNGDSVIEHGAELFWLVVFSGVFVVSCLMNRFNRFLAGCAACVTFYFLAVDVKLPWVKSVSFGDNPYYFTFDNAPLYLFFALPVIVFIADVISRESFRATTVMSGIIAAAYNVILSFLTVVLATTLNHVLVPDTVVLDVAKQFLITMAIIQFDITVSIQSVDFFFNGSKRFAFLRVLLTVADCVGSMFLLRFYYQRHIITGIVLPWVEKMIYPLTLVDLIPLFIAVGSMILILMGVTAGIAPYPSVVGSLLFVLVGVNICGLVVFFPHVNPSGSHKIPSAFANSPFGHVVVSVLTATGLLLSLLPLFNGSPVAESINGMVSKYKKAKEEKAKKAKKTEEQKKKTKKVEEQKKPEDGEKPGKKEKKPTKEPKTPVKTAPVQEAEMEVKDEKSDASGFYDTPNQHHLRNRVVNKVDTPSSAKKKKKGK